MKIPKEYKPFIKAAEAAGWILDVTGKGHLRLRPPRGWRRADDTPANPVTCPQSPSDTYRGAKNFRRDLRKQGLDV